MVDVFVWWDWRSWLARQVVALKAVGSNPISHPMKKALALASAFFNSVCKANRISLCRRQNITVSEANNIAELLHLAQNKTMSSASNCNIPISLSPRKESSIIMRHINIPVFIPHEGCPNACVFCNQRSISGTTSFDPSAVDGLIREALTTVGKNDTCEIAFFGGSFTGIDRSLMLYLLGVAQKYVDMSAVESIRLSTRPDYINDQVISDLKRFSVRTVELGLQSMRDSVLTASGRGHDASCARAACKMLKSAGFSLIGQMMIGLPASCVEDEIYTARELVSLGVDGVRVYPTVVFFETELACMTERGQYEPLTNEQAVMRTKEVLDVFDRSGVPCIRVGLCASENLADESKVMAGASHSAIGELAMSELYFDRICAELDKNGFRGGELIIYVARGNVSKAVGQKKRNKVRICQKYGFKSVKVLEKNEILSYNIIMEHNI